MHPPSTMSFEPGLERGVPWGRDLFTFVTSAAGHMMRTLQKPRKNKPSKRQVNHRRFLHNMIQRKFAEIEAANQQLASALFSVDTSQNQPELKLSGKNEAKNRKTAILTTCETETPTTQHDEANERKTLHRTVVNPEITFLKSKALNHPNSEGGSQPWEVVEEFEPSLENSPQQTADFSYEREQIQSTTTDLDNLSQVTNILLEDSVFSWLESIERIRQRSDVDDSKHNDVEQEYLGITLLDMLPTSPAVSALSLDSCDFEEQMHPESDHISEVQHISESLQMDMMENSELLDSSEGCLHGQYKDHRNMANVWHMQKEEGQNCFQDTLMFQNTPQEGYVMDDQTECADGHITEGLEVGPQTSTLLESSLRYMNAEHDLRGIVPSSPSSYGSTCQQKWTRYAARQTRLAKDCYVGQPITDINTTTSKEGQYSGSCLWNFSEKNLEKGKCSNHSINNQVLPRPEHVHSNRTLTNNWDQYHTHKNYTSCRVTDPYMLIDAEKKPVETEDTLCPVSDYVSPPNQLASSTTHCYGFDVPTLGNCDCRGDSCLYLSDEGDGSIPSFEGVAQSFPAPMYKPHPHPVLTPPLNDDWLFSNIVAEDFNGMVISPEYSYC